MIKLRFTSLMGAVIGLAVAGSALACACMPGDAAEQLKSVDVAFIGTAETIKPYRTIMGDTITIARFKIDETLVGAAQPWREVVYVDRDAGCGARYAVGRSYAVLTKRGYEGQLWPVDCVEHKQTIEDYIKAVRPTPQPDCTTVAGPPAAYLVHREPVGEIGQPGVVWRRCTSAGDFYLATKTTRSSKGLCRIRVLNGAPFLVSEDHAEFVTSSAQPCPALSLDRSASRSPYTAVAGELSDREFSRLHRWVAQRGGGALRLIEHHDALFGLWRNYALWVQRDGQDVFLRRRGFFRGLLV